MQSLAEAEAWQRNPLSLGLRTHFLHTGFTYSPIGYMTPLSQTYLPFPSGNFVQEGFQDLLRFSGYLVSLKRSNDRCMPIESITQSCST